MGVRWWQGHCQSAALIQCVENFIRYYRDDLQDADSNRPMTFHGLRHTYAAERYAQLVQEGCTAKAARLRVARLLGHGRDSVTRIYTVSVETK